MGVAIYTRKHLLHAGSGLQRRVPALEFYLYCQDDGKCVLKQLGDKEIHKFTDILEAVTFISYLDVDRTSTLTVFDPLGNVTFKDLLSSRHK